MEVTLYFRDKYGQEYGDRIKITVTGSPERVENIVDAIRRTVEDWNNWVES